MNELDMHNDSTMILKNFSNDGMNAESMPLIRVVVVVVKDYKGSV